MTYKQIGAIKILEKNGLKVLINYDKVISRIEEEISNSYIYTQGTIDKNLYFFGKKDIPQTEYIESLKAIERLIDNIFTDTPSIDIFDFLSITKKGTFAKNRVVNIASPIAGLFINCDYYKYVEFFALQTCVNNEKEIEVGFFFLQSDVNKFEPIFFEDYSKPIIRTKLKAIKRTDLKPGMIYSDEKQKKYFLFLGNFLGTKGTRFTDSILKKSKTLLTFNDFSDDDILNKIKENHEEEKRDAIKYEYKYVEKPFVYVKLTKKEFEKIKTSGKKEDFENLIRNCLTNKNGLSLYAYETPIRVFHEEMEYVENIKPIEIINKLDVRFIDNVSGPIFYGGLDRDYYSSCYFTYIKYE